MAPSKNEVITKNKTIPELRKIAIKNGITGYSHLNKAQLLSKLCARLKQPEDLGKWHGYGYQDMTKKRSQKNGKRSWSH